MDDKILCPMVDKEIDDIDCIENRDVADGVITIDSIPKEYTLKQNWKDICKNCKYHNY